MSLKDQSNEEMCLEAGMPPESQPHGLSESTQSRVSDFSDDATLRDSEHSLPSCDESDHTETEGNDADSSEADKQENTEIRHDPCPLCDEIFTNPAEYTLHLKKHTDGTKCLVCGKILSSANSLDRHLLVHSGEKPFECQHCGKSFTTNGNMNRHKRKRKHTSNCIVESSEKKAKKEVYSSEVSNPPIVVASKGRLHDCSHCVYGFRSLVKTGLSPKNFALISRMDCERRRTCPLNTNNCERTPDDANQAKVCEACGDTCLRTSDLQSMGCNDDIFICNICGSGFISQERFKIHKLHHKFSIQNQVLNIDIRREKNKYRFLQTFGLCKREVMPKVTGSKKTDVIREESVSKEPDQATQILNSTPDHQRDNSSDLADVSAVVSLSSKSTRNVTSPMSADCASPISNTVPAPASPGEGSSTPKECTADNELQCKECGECFKTKKLLKIHYHQIHLLKNTFGCPQCSYVSTDKSTLTRHIRIHTGERPYMCVICHRKFTTETNAKRHIKKRHNIFEKHKKYIVCNSSEKSNANSGNTKCHYCKKDFGDSKLLTQHKNAPDCPGKPYICSECPMRFPTKNNCLRHMTHQHKLQRDEAREAMIIDKLDPNKDENNHKIQKFELILEAADNDVIADEVSSTPLEIVVEKDNSPEESLNHTNDSENPSSDVEAEILDMTVGGMQNSFSHERETNSTHLSLDNVCQRPSSTEVDVSYSMLRLSEELPYEKEQQEPLDLSIRPIDLSAKYVSPEQNNTEMYGRISSQFNTPPPAHISSSAESKQSSHHNLLNFLNMSPFAHSHASQFEPERLVLDIQYHQPQNNFASVSSVPEFQEQAKNLSHNTIPLVDNTADNSDSEQELFIVEDTTSTNFSNDNSAAQTSPLKHSSDNEINDLASVSSVIDTANSQDISKFLNPTTFNTAHSPKSEMNILSHGTKSNIIKNSVDSNKKFPCCQCNKSFDTSSALKRHMVIHTGVKKHKCSTCGKPFGTKSNCKRHELTHLPKNTQKHRGSSVESQSTSDVSNNDNFDIPSFNAPTDQPKRYDRSIDFPQGTFSRSFDAGHVNPSSSVLATFSHLLSENFCSRQNFECKFCLNSYKNVKDLTNHMKELHPIEYRGEMNHLS